MSLPEHIFDHIERALDNLVTPLFDKPVITAIVKAVASEVQELEDAAWSCIAERLLDTASGVQLDQWGEVLGEPRLGLNDIEYRAFLAARILSNLSEGEPDRLARILSILVGGAAARYVPHYPAGMMFEYVTDEPTSEKRRARINAQMEAVAPAGVEVDYITEASSGYFGFADNPDALGFGDGLFAEII